MIELRRLRLLHELNRLGTLAAVAESLHLSASSVSSQLALLEKELGVKLLEKVGRGVRLTPAAYGLIAHIDVILDRMDLISLELSSLDTEPRGTIRIASFQSAMIELLPSALEVLRANQHLRIEVTQMEPEQSLPALASHDFDLVLAEEFASAPAPTFTGIVREPLCRDRMQVAIGAGLEVPRVRRGYELGLSDLRHLPWIMEPHGTISHAWVLGLCRAAGFEPDVRHESPDLLAQIAMVRKNHAVALLPDLFTSSHRTDIELYPIGDASRLIFVATRRSHASSPALRAVRKALHSSATSLGLDVI